MLNPFLKCRDAVGNAAAARVCEVAQRIANGMQPFNHQCELLAITEYNKVRSEFPARCLSRIKRPMMS